MVVPRAAPAMPIAGHPRRPKIKIALRMILRKRDTRYTTVDMMTRSTLRMMLR